MNGVGDAFAFVAPFGDGWYRIFAWNRLNQVDDSAPVELSEVREVTRRALGTDFGMHEPRFLSRFHSDERQVPTYRVGRVFLAGDAAHCHSPAGGQGMNTGIQDAANLGWKLAAAVDGWGGEQLLDSYHAERHPVGRQVLRSSGLLVRLALIRPRWARAVRDTVAYRAAGDPADLGAGRRDDLRDRRALPGAARHGPSSRHPRARRRSAPTGAGCTTRCGAVDSCCSDPRPRRSTRRLRWTSWSRRSRESTGGP